MVKFLTTKEVSQMLRCTPATVTNLIKRGAFPAIKIGHGIRVDGVTENTS